MRAKNRVIAVIILLSFFVCGIYIILSNLRDNIVFFYPPSEIAKIKLGHKTRVGGIVKHRGINRLSTSKISFIVTDENSELIIEYEGILPALFREGQGIVAEGMLRSDKIFIAEKLLTKHDENYSPPKIKN